MSRHYASKAGIPAKLAEVLRLVQYAGKQTSLGRDWPMEIAA